MSCRPDRHRPPTLVVLALAASAALPAADLLKDKPTGLAPALSEVHAGAVPAALRDFRLGVGMAPGISSFDASTATWNGNAKTEARPALALTPSFTLGGFWSNGFGLGVSLGVPWRRSDGTTSNGDRIRISAYGIEIGPLIALRLEPRFHLELAVPLAAGFARQEMPGLEADRAEWWSTGVRLGGYWTWPGGWQVGGELGLLAMSTMGRVKDGSGPIDLVYHSRGATASLTLGHRF